jgi:RimJ/RimL family protein N-acetyltransferase
VISLIRPDNTPSIRVAQRLGQRHERTIELHGGAAHVYAIERHESEAPAPSR